MRSMKIAVVGSGISGLSCAWLLSHRHDVCLFESDSRLGGHSNTVDCREYGRNIAIDTGFIVYNHQAYPNLVALLDHLDVPTARTNMGFGVSFDGGRYEYAGSGPLQLLGGLANLVDGGHWRMLNDVRRFFRTGMAQSSGLADTVGIAAFLEQHGYSDDFLQRHLLPMAAAIWSSAPGDMRDYPAQAFLRFFDNHGLLKFTSRPEWRTVIGGSREYVRRLSAGDRLTLRLATPVTRIERDTTGVTVISRGGHRDYFDHAVIATHADQALAILANPSPAERSCLAAFRYSRNIAVLHRDHSFMPRRRRLWSSWNYVGTGPNGGCAVTYWMNNLQPLAAQNNYFVTLNPHVAPDADKTEAVFTYDHPIFDAVALGQQKRLWSLQGHQHTWFCGAHFGSGFHEDGLQTGLAVAEQLGGVRRPWRVADASGRIHVASPAGGGINRFHEAAE